MDNERQKPQIRISVRSLVEFLLRGGDIDNRRTSSAEKDAMLAGGRMHRKIQHRMGSAYQAEVTLRHTVDMGSFELLIEGRADGVITTEDGTVIDEIKSVYQDIDMIDEPVPVHRAQALCYAYFIGCDRELESVGIQITYCSLRTEEVKRFSETHDFAELRDWFTRLTEEFEKWASFLLEHKAGRDASLRELSFPYPYREGQEELARSVYRAIMQGKEFFIQAPTGVGKTLSVVYPALKAMGNGAGERIFYLTAKTLTRTAAEDCFSILRAQGLRFFTVTITAKEKLCPLGRPECNPEACPRAKGHFDRVNEAVFSLLTSEDAITRDVILSCAERYQVCPFEFCLDLCGFADGIICDYNYVFDPNVRLKRFFSEGDDNDSVFLVDEAHNLVDRARGMYSADLLKEDVLSQKRVLKDRSRTVSRCLDRLNRRLLELRKSCEEEGTAYRILRDEDIPRAELAALFGELDAFLEKEREFDGRDEVLDFYFSLRHFLAMSEDMNDCYRIYCEQGSDGFYLRLFNIDPSHRLAGCMQQARCTVFFSATLLPVLYYKKLLSGNIDDYAVYAGSPFDTSRRLLLIGSDVSSRYTRRNAAEYGKVVEYIRMMAGSHVGNYLAFFPSYSYMEGVESILSATDGVDFVWKKQESHMSDEEKEAFLSEFENVRNCSFVGLCVLGGTFSEGIDLTDERLEGAMIVGTGLPMVCREQEILKGYFDERGEDGFDYAYRIPGMNKVMQAAGRVIRTVTDRGVILLLDDRFLGSREQSLFPREWSEYTVVNRSSVGAKMLGFWGSFDD